jgi:hypothetical protein
MSVPDAIGLPQNGYDLLFISQVHCALSAKVNLLTNDLCTTFFNSESLCCAHLVYMGVMYYSYSKQLLFTKRNWPLEFCNGDIMYSP